MAYAGRTFGLLYNYRVVAKDARGSERVSGVGAFLYP
jgi:hypothetical protein